MDLETKSLKYSEENVPIYRCEICDETFTLYKNLEYHVGSIHENTETPKILQCKTCDKCFTKTELLKRHEDVVHTGLCRFKCNECEKSVSSKAFRQNYFDAIHNDKKYMCDYCENTFGSKTCDFCFGVKHSFFHFKGLFPFFEGMNYIIPRSE